MVCNQKMMKRRVIYALLTAILMGGCSLDEHADGLYVSSDVSDLSAGLAGWQVDFAEYPATAYDSAQYELQFSYTELPDEVTERTHGVMMSGYNPGSGLFMFMKKKVTGLKPNTDYTLVFDVELASNASSGLFGNSDGTGENVLLKGGASSMEPRKMIEGERYVLNIDKGYALDGGEDMTVLGNIAVAPNTTQYALISRTNANNYTPFLARSNSRGELWLIVGTDSSYLGITTVYYTRVNVVFSAYYD